MTRNKNLVALPFNKVELQELENGVFKLTINNNNLVGGEFYFTPCPAPINTLPKANGFYLGCDIVEQKGGK